MFIFIKFLILWGLIKFLMETEEPFWCAGIYTFIQLLILILTGNPLETIIIQTLIAGALATLYFWVLDKLLGKGIIFGVVAVLGAVIGVV